MSPRSRGAASSGHGARTTRSASWRARVSLVSLGRDYILERSVIEKILTHLGLDPPPSPEERAREAEPGFAA